MEKNMNGAGESNADNSDSGISKGQGPESVNKDRTAPSRRKPLDRSVRWERSPEHDLRIRHGDDFAGDAWRHPVTKEVHWTGVGVDLNKCLAQKPGNAGEENNEEGQRSMLERTRRTRRIDR